MASQRHFKKSLSALPSLISWPLWINEALLQSEAELSPHYGTIEVNTSMVETDFADYVFEGMRSKVCVHMFFFFLFLILF